MLKKGGEVDVFHCLTQMKVTEMAFTGKCKLDKFANVEMCANWGLVEKTILRQS